MNTEDLLECIREHEGQCSLSARTRFTIVKVREIAPGIIATLDSDGEFAVYFDTERYRVKQGCGFDDVAEKIKHFPAGVGLLVDVTARDWKNIIHTANIFLEQRPDILWHKKDIPLKY